LLEITVKRGFVTFKKKMFEETATTENTNNNIE